MVGGQRVSAHSSSQPSPQTEASDPRNSAWVSANAGSGKTTVLVRRVIRLLLDGVPPNRVLCLTYTKAAAAHMANKVLQTLSSWVRFDDAALDRAIEDIESRRPDAERRARARRLFAAALETPGGLKVQTIHAFCDRVLHMFPVEAGVPAGFDVLDEAGERDMIERARIETLLEAGRNPDSELGRALQSCVEISGDQTIEQAIAECLRSRAKILLADATSARSAILASLGLSANESYATLSSEILNGSLPRGEWAEAAQALIALGGNAGRIGAALSLAAGETNDPLQAYLSIFFTAEGEPKADKTFGKKADLASLQRLGGWLFEERERLVPLLDKLHAAQECERSCALLTLAQSVIARYGRAKQRRGVLDFADLVGKAVALLEREESAWVHYKLDGGIEHILVDEAQDTSPEQWRIVAKLAEEFFAGKGASERERSIFVVGDEKQSIFSFQGADPRRFEEMRNFFASEVGNAGQVLREPRLRVSYRSAATVLRAVDHVFSFEHARRGLSAHDSQGPHHEAVRRNAPGTVEIWPPETSVKSADDEDGWDRPLDRLRETSAKMRLAQNIAKAVKHWISGGLSVSDRDNEEVPRAVTAGDIIILVQSRGPLFDAILRALKREHVDVAGADRLKLTENIAVMDLMALGDALLLIEDDLSLACVLKSPLFGMDDDDLFALCHTRSGTLFESLRKTPGNDRYKEAAEQLARWREQAAHLRPFDFYARILGREGGRKKMIARLGPEAADALDEFLTAALAYEKMETPSLQGFLRYLRRAEMEVKRDLQTESRLVRVMTVHGVKGLEAPVVVLADTTTLPHPTKEARVVPLHAANASPADEPSLIWTASKKQSSAASLSAKDRARDLRLEEYRRLLYVALTRAADVLVVAGALNKNKDEAEAGSWYDLVKHSILADTPNLTTHDVPYCSDPVTRWRASELPAVAPAERQSQPLLQRASWLDERPKPAASPRRRLRPSFSQMPILRERGIEGGKRRGVLLHRLLQSLPDVSQGERHAAALRYLSQAAPDFPEDMREALAAEALGVINHEDCAALFAPGSRAEPELIAHLGEGAEAVEIAARIDRLHISAETILFGDFKSDARVPVSPREIPAPYLEQLAAYRAALLQAFPGRAARALLIYTARPRVFEIPAESLESAWQRLKTQTSPAFATALS
jgi:ATP-dependent helicase/nuclease subunit A